MNITEEKIEAARLYFVEGLSAREVSERTGIPHNSVKAIVQNLRIRGIMVRKYKGKMKR